MLMTGRFLAIVMNQMLSPAWFHELKFVPPRPSRVSSVRKIHELKSTNLGLE